MTMREQNLRLRDGRGSLKHLYFCQSLSLWSCGLSHSSSQAVPRASAAVVLSQCHLFDNPHQLLPGSGIGLWSVLVL